MEINQDLLDTKTQVKKNILDAMNTIKDIRVNQTTKAEKESEDPTDRHHKNKQTPI